MTFYAKEMLNLKPNYLRLKLIWKWLDTLMLEIEIMTQKLTYSKDKIHSWQQKMTVCKDNTVKRRPKQTFGKTNMKPK